MKKLVMTVAVLTCAASFVSAQTVTSANIVGYAKMAAPAAGAFQLYSFTQFTDGTTNGTVDVQEMISNLDDLNAAGLGSDLIGADRLYVWTGTKYDQYALFQDGAVGPYWAATSEGGWTSGLEFLGVNAAVATVGRGSAAWLETGAGGTSVDAIVAGEVPMDGTNYVDVAMGFTLLAYPYTSEINVDSLDVINSASAGLGSNMVGADKLYVWTGTKYEQYALFQDGAVGPYWAATSEGGWTPGLEFLGVAPASFVIEISGGFWYESDTAKSVGFVKNY